MGESETERVEPAEPAVYHVSHDTCTWDWKVTREGRPFAIARFEDKADAVAYGRRALEEAAAARLVVHRPDGSLESEVAGPGQG